MKLAKTSTAMFIAASALTSALIFPVDSWAATNSRFQCSAIGTADISMKARYDIIRTVVPVRRKFTTEFEAGPGTGFLAGNVLKVKVDGVLVGRLTLVAFAGGDVAGDLNFDTIPHIDAVAFPAVWPAGVGSGSRVKLLRGTTTVLGCTMH